jgi:UDP-N-acetylmuramoyl-L-alanyl-D-glutamate--2,6-diaminopimelate ligase
VTARVIPSPPTFKRQMLTVGVTGTNGKTSTTAFVAAALARSHRPVARATTVGTFLDDEPIVVTKDYDGFVELMRRCTERGGRLAAIELTSEALFHGFGKAWPCEVGVFTNLTHDHLDAHGSPEHYLASKAQLFLGIPVGGTAVLNACDSSAELLRDVVPHGVRILTYGVASTSRGATLSGAQLDALAESVDVTWAGTTAKVVLSPVLGGGSLTLRTQGIGEIYAENALAAWVGAVAAGVPRDAAAQAIADAPAPAGRFQIVADRPHVVVDYAHTPDALTRTLATGRRLCKGRLWVVFGAGGNRDKAKREPMGHAASDADHVVLTSDNPRDEDPEAIALAIRKGVSPEADLRVILDRARAIESAVRAAGPDDVVVIAGRGHETEQLVGKERLDFSDVEVAKASLQRDPLSG